jgi:hypothetical protein
MKRPASFVAGGLFLLAATGPLGAADLVTVKVPLRLTSLDPSISAIQVVCVLTGRDPATDKSRPFSRSKGTALGITERGGRRQVDETSVQVVFTDADFASAERERLDRLTGGSCGLSAKVDGAWVEMQETGGPGLALTPKLNTPFRARAAFSF